MEMLAFWVSLKWRDTDQVLGEGVCCFRCFFSCGLQSNLVPSVRGAGGGCPAQTNPVSLHPPGTSPPPGGHQDPNPQHPRGPTTNCKQETHCNAKPRCSAKRKPGRRNLIPGGAGNSPGTGSPVPPVPSGLMLLLRSAGTGPEEKGLRRFPVRLENRPAVFSGGQEGRRQEAVYSGPRSTAPRAPSPRGGWRAQPACGSWAPSPPRVASPRAPLCPSCPRPFPPLPGLGTPFPAWHPAGPTAGTVPAGHQDIAPPTHRHLTPHPAHY